jgi:pyruvate kinase
MEKKVFQKTKILTTIGPASSSYNVLLDLARAGMDAVRLNFSHGKQEDHLKIVEYVQHINRKYQTNISILGDLQGPKLRIGELENDGFPLKKGDVLTFINEPCIGVPSKIYMSYETFAADVKAGEKVLVDDGKVELLVLETNGKDTVKLEVLYGNYLSSRKGVNLPDTQVSLPSMTEKDLADLEFMLQHPFNWIALSFVRSAKDIHEIRALIQAKNHPAKIIAKIEKPEAIRNIDEIIDAVDGIMIARGDLGVELPMEQLPMLQKMIIKKCIEKAKPVIVATQMMDSMIKNPSPTRAEIIDVANAVIDGADVVMLSNETAMGDHPAKVVEAMSRIVQEAEKMDSVYYRNNIAAPEAESFISDALCYTACRLAREVNAKTIIGMTKSGYTAFMVAAFRPKADIFIFSADHTILNILSLVWGVRCFYYDKFTTTDDTIHDVQEILKAKGLVQVGDIVVNTGSMPLHERKKTNMLRVSVVE